MKLSTSTVGTTTLHVRPLSRGVIRPGWISTSFSTVAAAADYSRDRGAEWVVIKCPGDAVGLVIAPSGELFEAIELDVSGRLPQ